MSFKKKSNHALANHNQDGFQAANQFAEPEQPSCSLRELSSGVRNCTFDCLVWFALFDEPLSDFKYSNYKSLHF